MITFTRQESLHVQTFFVLPLASVCPGTHLWLSRLNENLIKYINRDNRQRIDDDIKDVECEPA